MEEPKRITQIVFLGYRDKSERVRYILRKFIPHRIYFIRASESLAENVEGKDVRDIIKKDYEKEVPKWVADEAEEIELPFYNFEESFPKILKIMVEEKKAGNEVYVSLHGASHLIGVACAMAATLTGAKIFFVMPNKYVSVNGGKDMKAIGAKTHIEAKIPLMLQLPKKEEASILKFLLKQNGNFKGKLVDIVSNVGLEKLGANIKKPNSGIVKASKIISKLKNDGYIETKKISRKVFQVSLTDKGKLQANVVNLLD